MDIWVVMESTYRVDYGKPIVVLYSRNYNNKFQTATHEFSGFKPYFYAPANEAHVTMHSRLIDYIDHTICIDAFGREVKKVYTHLPYEVKYARELFSWSDAADTLFDKRFLADKHIKYAYQIVDGEPIPVEVPDPIEPRIVYCDIEVKSPQGIFPDAMQVKYPIVSIQCMDSYTKKMVVFTAYVPPTTFTTQVQCLDENELLLVYCEYLKNINPDIIAFWNGDSFDIPYIINRARKIKASIDGFSRNNKCFCKYDENTAEIRLYIGGRSTLDMMEAFKKYSIGGGQRESNGLKSVIADEELLGECMNHNTCESCQFKHDYSSCPNYQSYAFEYDDLGPILEKIFNEKRFDEFVDYCQNDVIALQHIDECLGLYHYFESIRFVSGSKIMDSLHNSAIIKMLLMHEGIKPMPTVNRVADKEKFKGALVIDPPIGVHEWVATVDVAALYPNIMVGFNVCPDIDGVTIKALKKFMDLREHYRALKKQGVPGADALDSSCKTIVNSFYGVLGAPTFPLYIRDNAEFVTTTGQKVNKFIQSVVKSINKTVLYGDTDSVFLSEVKSKTEALSIQDILNEELARWCDEKGSVVHIKLKAEKLFRRLLFKAASGKGKKSTKKKYAGHLIWKEGEDKDELAYMGIELARSDNSLMTKDILITFLTKMFIDGEYDEAIKYVKTKYYEVRNGNVNVYDISMPKSVRKLQTKFTNPHKRGIEYAKERFNFIVSEGTKPRLLYLKHGEICIDDEFDVEQIKDDVNYKLMAEKTIKDKMESYLVSVGENWNMAVEGQQAISKWL